MVGSIIEAGLILWFFWSLGQWFILMVDYWAWKSEFTRKERNREHARKIQATQKDNYDPFCGYSRSGLKLAPEREG